MMVFSSSLSPEEYRRNLKARIAANIGGWLFEERIGGWVIGNFFGVTHYMEYKWDRRYRRPWNNAYGYIKRTANGSEIHFFHTHGALNLRGLLFGFFFGWILMGSVMEGENPWGAAALGLGAAGALLGIGAFSEGLSDAAQEGEDTLYSLLLEP